MAAYSTIDDGSAGARAVPQAPGWLALAASPSFALMGLIAAIDAPRTALCASGVLPVDGMTAMYALMSLFHLPPWLALVRGRPAARA
jgi:hypothetical protein